MFLICRLQKELTRKKRILLLLYAYFIDLIKTYDSIDLTPLWKVPAHFCVPRRGVLGVVYCGTGPSPRVRARAPPVQHLLRGGYKRGLHAFQSGRRHHGRFGAPQEENGGEGGGRREATAGEPALATSVWGMLYADNVGVVSRSP